MKKHVFDSAAFILFFILIQHANAFGRDVEPAVAEHGMVVSTDRFASTAGLEILKKGGNAIDAAVATAFAMAVTYPSCGNIGGEGFLLYYGSGGLVSAIDFRAQAPAAATRDMFLNEKGTGYKKSPIKGLHVTDSPIAIGIPGTVAGLALAHRKFGCLPWADLLEPAIELAERGFRVGERLHDEMKDSRKYFLKYPSSTRSFLKDGKAVYEPGEIWRQPDLAATLRRIQEHGEDEFYRGRTAELIVASMEMHGGLITMEDLDTYRAIERKPDHGVYRGYDVWAMPLPSSGGITQMEILNLLEGYKLEEMGHNSALYLHVLTEAMRRAYRDRALYLGDPDFVSDVPAERLKSKEYAEWLRTTIDLEHASKSEELDTTIWLHESMETTHFSVVDSMGNAVSVTYTLNGDFGAYLVAEGTGIVLNNSLPDFNSTIRNGGYGKANLIEPGKRPLSSMTPTIIARDGSPLWIIGSPGGTTIISTNVQIMLNLIDFSMNIAEAVDAPRIFHGWLPDETLFQKGGVTNKETRKKYESMGHRVKDFRWAFGPAMCIHIDHDRNLYYGAADRRSPDALAAGY